MQYSGREALAIADPERGSCHHRPCEAAWVPAFAQPSGRPVQSRVLSGLGYSPEDWRRLEADLPSRHPSKDATPEEGTSYGQKYAIRATLVGPSGQSADVVSVWVVRRGEEFPRFVTAYPGGDRERTGFSTPSFSTATYLSTASGRAISARWSRSTSQGGSKSNS